MSDDDGANWALAKAQPNWGKRFGEVMLTDGYGFRDAIHICTVTQEGNWKSHVSNDANDEDLLLRSLSAPPTPEPLPKLWRCAHAVFLISSEFGRKHEVEFRCWSSVAVLQGLGKYAMCKDYLPEPMACGLTELNRAGQGRLRYCY